MKVKIVYDFSPEMRDALSHFFGDKKRATHAICRSWAEMTLESELETLSYDLIRSEELPKEKERFGLK